MTHAHSQALPAGSRVDQYVVEHRLGGGGFSIVYLAREVGTDRRVVLKEYMPRKLAQRVAGSTAVQPRDNQSADQLAYGRRLFFQEASTLANLKHPNIVNVVNFFRANGTVYMVMEYREGLNLQDYIKRHRGSLSETLIRTVFTQLLEGLKLIHGSGLLHLDIKPGNVFLCKGGKPLLLDFGAVHPMMQSRRDQPSQVITPGYSPIEQSTPGGYVGPWSDLYALGATMRTCIENTTPPPAAERRMKEVMRPALKSFRKHYSTPLLSAIDWAMEVDPELRPQSVEQLLEVLEASVEVEQPPAASMFDRLTNSLPWK